MTNKRHWWDRFSDTMDLILAYILGAIMLSVVAAIFYFFGLLVSGHFKH